MIGPFGHLRPPAALPDGQRVYAIGDIHGEAALFKQLLGHILVDAEARGSAETRIVILGDFIDRGESGAELLTTLATSSNEKVVILKGNHEASLVESYRGDLAALEFWLRFGGATTLLGMGATRAQVDADDLDGLLATLRATIDADLIAWLDALPTHWMSGDYYFTHAGIRPGVPLDEQAEDDLLWIRQPFLKSRRDHGKIVVHGHTVEPGVPRLGGNRIGLDTGAHEHGRLTALGLEGDRQWILQAQ